MRSRKEWRIVRAGPRRNALSLRGSCFNSIGGPQSLRKFLVNTAEASIREDGNHVAGAHFWSGDLHDAIYVGNHAGTAAKGPYLRCDGCDIETLAFRDRVGLEDVGE